MKPGFRRFGPTGVVTNIDYGHSFGRPYYNERQVEVNRGYQSASASAKSDFTTPTRWSGEKIEMIADSPYSCTEINWHHYDGERGRNTSIRFISSEVTDLAFWYESRGFNEKIANASSRSLTVAREKLASGQFQLGVTVGEAKHTADMLGGTAGQLFQGLLAAKRGNWREIPDILGLSRKKVLSGEFPANKWLEYQYGWKPLVSDSYSLYNKLRSVVEEPLFIYGNCWSPVEIDLKYQSGKFTVRQRDKGGVRVKLCAKIQNSFARDMNSWGLINPLSIAWELTPFSFMVDWGIPIGNVLNSLTATAGLDFVWGFESTKSESSFSLTYEPSNTNQWFYVTSNGDYRWKRAQFDRRPLRGFPLPQLYGEEMPFTTTRIANAIAIARQLFTGR